MRLLRKSLPLVVSLALLGWLLWYVGPSRFVQQVGELKWQILLLLLPMTGLLVLVLYLWESVCLLAVFSLPDRPLGYRQMLRVRGLSYLVGVVNYEAGQALAAWKVASLQGTSVLSGLSRALLLAYHDLLVLFGLGTLGAFLATDERLVMLRPFCAAALGCLATVGVLSLLLPAGQRQRLQGTRWGAWMATWTWGRTARLLALRCVYFLIIVTYAAAALRIVGIPVDHTLALGTIPLVVLADAIPSVGGIGPRDISLQILLGPGQPQVAAMSLIWSVGVLVGRFLIGLFHFWWPSQAPEPENQTSAAETAERSQPGATAQSLSANIAR